MKKLYLIDGSNHAFRVFFALPKMTANGIQTGALLGFANLLKKLEREHQPDYIAVVFDKGKSFRNDLYPEYKGHRPDMPTELREQWPKFPDLVRAWGYPCLAIGGVEADDVIGTLAQWAEDDLEVTIVSGDKDFYQLIAPNVRILDVMKGRVIGPTEVAEKFGVGPERVIDALALAGDSSDNVPGVSGIGAKTAAKLLHEFGDLDSILSSASTIKGKRGETLVQEADMARLSRQLVTIKLDVEVDISLASLAEHTRDNEKLRELFLLWQFRNHLKDLAASPEAVAQSRVQFDRDSYQTIATSEQLDALGAALRNAGTFAFDLETTSLNPLEAELVGIALAWDKDQVAYIPVGHTQMGMRVPNQLEKKEVMNTMAPLLQDATLGKVGQNVKYDIGVLECLGYSVNGVVSDTMLLDYLLEPERSRHGLDDLAMRYFGHSMITYAQITEKTGKDSFSEVSIEEATHYAGEDAHLTWRLHHELLPRLLEHQLEDLYRKLELPVAPILGRMEREGIGIDLPSLASLSKEFGSRLEEIEGRIFFLAGREFTIGSPKQLQKILFEERGLKPVKKTKTGFSTDAETLEALALVDPLPAQILAYRSLAKLKSTYVDTLPAMTSPRTGRVHTSFHQAVTATGRLSSNNPNLQNIPIRSEDGRRIRACFVAREGHVFLSCDYSQVELRVLAHYCKTGPLVEAFLEDQDIHRKTASEIFDTPFAEVTNDQRSSAKAINFGIVYGMSAFRLSNELRISRKHAQAYLDNYFARYPQVKRVQEELIEDARKNGYAQTLWGRRRPIPDIAASNARDRAAAERIALNTPMQGTGADIIKKAMIRVHQGIESGRIEGTLLLQVHDELLLEVPESAIETTAKQVKQEMEAAAELNVPLLVESGWARTWADAH